MRLERTQDAELIKSVVTHDAIWPHVSDSNVSRETWEPVIHDTVHQLAIYDDEGLGGCFILMPLSSVCWEVHTCILPTHRGWKAREATKLCAAWMFANTECLHIVTKIPSYNRPAYKLAIDSGLRNLGMIESAWMKDGEVYDLYLLGLRKWQ